MLPHSCYLASPVVFFQAASTFREPLLFSFYFGVKLPATSIMLCVLLLLLTSVSMTLIYFWQNYTNSLLTLFSVTF